jgi:hypothetical protein
MIEDQILNEEIARLVSNVLDRYKNNKTPTKDYRRITDGNQLVEIGFYIRELPIEDFKDD